MPSETRLLQERCRVQRLSRRHDGHHAGPRRRSGRAAVHKSGAVRRSRSDPSHPSPFEISRANPSRSYTRESSRPLGEDIVEDWEAGLIIPRHPRPRGRACAGCASCALKPEGERFDLALQNFQARSATRERIPPRRCPVLRSAAPHSTRCRSWTSLALLGPKTADYDTPVPPACLHYDIP